MTDVMCPKCGGKTYRVPEKMGWRIRPDGVFSYPDADFCVKGDWKQRVADSERRIEFEIGPR